MKIIFFLISCALIVFGDLTTATSIECLYSEYKHYNSEPPEFPTYKCEVYNNPEIKVKDSAKIRSINKIPANLNATFDDVVNFRIIRKTIIHFPRGLNSDLKNIEAIEIIFCHLKELDQLDLKQFPNLKRLHLEKNDIEVIEDGLFEFNSKLEHLQIYERNILHIAPNVFDHLSQLRVLWFKDISCFNQSWTIKKKVNENIQDVKKSCSNQEFLSMIEELENLQNDPDISDAKLANFENKLQNSTLFYSGTLWEKFESLKPHKMYKPVINADPETLHCPPVTPSDSSIKIECNNNYESFKFYDGSTFERDYTYYCNVGKNPNILTLESAKIGSINLKYTTYEKIKGFFASSGTIYYFPKGLDKFFKNLELIKIEYCHLKQIHQADLKPFPKLTYFSLIGNDIKVIEEGLFDYNLRLEAIELSEGNIIHIYPTVFDNLNSLECFKFVDVPCIELKISSSHEIFGIYESKRNVLKNIKILKKFCINSEFMALDAEIKKIDIKSKSLASNVENFEKNLNSSNFSNFLQFRNKITFLKAINKPALICERSQHIENVSSGSSSTSQNFIIGNFIKKMIFVLKIL